MPVHQHIMSWKDQPLKAAAWLTTQGSCHHLMYNLERQKQQIRQSGASLFLFSPRLFDPLAGSKRSWISGLSLVPKAPTDGIERLLYMRVFVGCVERQFLHSSRNQITSIKSPPMGWLTFHCFMSPARQVHGCLYGSALSRLCMF